MNCFRFYHHGKGRPAADTGAGACMGVGTGAGAGGAVGKNPIVELFGTSVVEVTEMVDEMDIDGGNDYLMPLST